MVSHPQNKRATSELFKPSHMMAGPRGEGKMQFHVLWKLFYKTEDCHTVIIHQSMSHNSDQVSALASGLHSSRTYCNCNREARQCLTKLFILPTQKQVCIWRHIYWEHRVLEVMIQSVLLLFGLLTLLYILSCENWSSNFLCNWLVYSREPEYMQCWIRCIF